MANADHNASVNLHKKFYRELPEVVRPDRNKRVFRVTKEGQAPIQVDMALVESKLRLRADDMCRGKGTPF